MSDELNENLNSNELNDSKATNKKEKKMAKKEVVSNDVILDICDKCQDARKDQWVPQKDADGNWVAEDPENFCFTLQDKGECELLKQAPELVGEKNYEKMKTCIGCTLGAKCCVISSFFSSEVQAGSKICPKTNEVYSNRGKRDQACEMYALRLMKGEVKVTKKDSEN